MANMERSPRGEWMGCMHTVHPHGDAAQEGESEAPLRAASQVHLAKNIE